MNIFNAFLFLWFTNLILALFMLHNPLMTYNPNEITLIDYRKRYPQVLFIT